MPITFKEVSYEYSANTPFAYLALDEINLKLADGKMTAIVGATGSGKSTLVQHLNALLIPTRGELEVADRKIVANQKNKGLKELRHQVGLVFQFPEYQLFEETIVKDVAFGPQNFGISENEATEIAKKAIRTVGLDDSYFEKSPLELSGGQKRRVAIAGILAMNPSVLVLDEPTAGLDPQGAKEMMALFRKLNTEDRKTVLIVTHDMEHVLNYCDDVVVVEKGHILMHVDKQTFFEDTSCLERAKINPPAVIRLRKLLQQQGFDIPNTILDLPTLAKLVRKEVAK
ncbi:MAG: energy-coupling factor transporter ATPase [Erysipelotrichaceae bacterium]|nr:energy-coupling factor transporter ATPase [Erysipelotrichaceae bacterium]